MVRRMADTLGLFPVDPDGDPVARSLVNTGHDPSLDQVEAWFNGQADLKERFAEIFRQSIDEVLDGQRTGRYDVNQLAKTEKTYLGTKVEIICQAAYELERGRRMDYLVAGHEVDAKFSIESPYKQSIPREAVGEICLLLHADDHEGRFTVGLIRAIPDVLQKGKGNQDGKRGIAASGRSRIRWLVRDGKLPENLLLSLPDQVRNSIFNAVIPNKRRADGQRRTNQLFALVQRRIIRREVVLAVARQDDGPKRVRDARLHLRLKGILILGHQGEHPRICRDLELPVPSKGQWVSLRVVPDSDDGGRPTTIINGVSYFAACPSDPECVGPERY
jgi:hypothetical protein